MFSYEGLMYNYLEDDDSQCFERHYFPLRDGLVLSHFTPDADSLCSSIAIAKFVRSRNKLAYVLIQNPYPKYLEWLIEENKDLITFDKNDDFCQSVDFLYIVDCSPDSNRIGFEIKDYKHSWFNIDHHVDRMFYLRKEPIAQEGSWYLNKDLKGNISYVEIASSLCSILIKNYSFKDDILALGIYYDTLYFEKDGLESIDLIKKLDITNERFNYIINKVKCCKGKIEYEKIINLVAWWHRSKKLCLLYDPSNSLDKQHIVDFIREYVETFVVISKTGKVSLRTSNKEIDVSTIASQFQGGGHKNAAGCKLNKSNLYDFSKKLTAGSSLDLNHEDEMRLASFFDDLYKFFE